MSLRGFRTQGVFPSIEINSRTAGRGGAASPFAEVGGNRYTAPACFLSRSREIPAERWHCTCTMCVCVHFAPVR